MKTLEREKLQKLFNEIRQVEEEKDKAFRGLQELSHELGLPMWCHASGNLTQILSNERANEKMKESYSTTYAERALELYDEYQKNKGMYETYSRLGCTLSDLKFWK